MRPCAFPSLHASALTLRVRLQHDVGDGPSGVDVAVRAFGDTGLLAAAQARSGLRDALLEALLTHGLCYAQRRGQRRSEEGRVRGSDRRRMREAWGDSHFGPSRSCVVRTYREEFLRVRIRQFRLDLVHHRLILLAVHPERTRRVTRRVVTIR